MKSLAIIALSTMLGASGESPIQRGAGNEFPSWYRPNATQDKIDQDADECERDARMHSPSFGSGMVGAQRAQELQDRCMKAKGYYRVRKDGTRIN